MKKLKLALILSCKTNVIPTSKGTTTLCVLIIPYSVHVFLFHVDNHINVFF